MAGDDGAVWPLAPTVSPNRQVGKLYFDVDPGDGVQWSWCTASAVNSETSRRSSRPVTHGQRLDPAVLPEHWFAPGYQYGALLDRWPVRYKVVTGNYYWSGASADDIAAVVVQPVGGQRIVDKLGGHGAWFNASMGNPHLAGLPGDDWRWPGYTADGEDARYCQGTDCYCSSGSWPGKCTSAAA